MDSLLVRDLPFRWVVTVGIVTNCLLLREHGDIGALSLVRSKLASDGARGLDLSCDVEQVELRNVDLYVFKPTLHHNLSGVLRSLRLGPFTLTGRGGRPCLGTGVIEDKF